VPIELLIEAAEDDGLGVDVLLRHRGPERVRLRVLARVVQVVAAPASEEKALTRLRFEFFCVVNFQCLFSQITNKQFILSRLPKEHCYDFPKKPYTLAGIEPGSSDPEADAMSTAPGCQGTHTFAILRNKFNVSSPTSSSTLPAI
jgi:hypothetical protein